MATQTFLATPTPAALPGTAADTMYSIQNQGEDLLFVAAAAAVPADPMADATPKIIVPSYSSNEAGTVQISHPSGEAIYLWSRHLGPDIRCGWDEV